MSGVEWSGINWGRMIVKGMEVAAEMRVETEYQTEMGVKCK